MCASKVSLPEPDWQSGTRYLASGVKTRCSRALGAAVERGGDADLALEGAAERSLGAVAHAIGDFGDARFARAKQRCCELDAPLREVLNGRDADQMREALG